MGIFLRKMPSHFIPIHPDNITKKDWIILLEAGTIIGPSKEKLRVATVDRKIVKKYNLFFRARRFLVMEEYDPRIHALYFCPQLYKLDSDHKLIPLTGEEIGHLLAQQLQHGVVYKKPWYEPADKLPGRPVIAEKEDTEFETLVVESPKVQPLAMNRSTAS